LDIKTLLNNLLVSVKYQQKIYSSNVSFMVYQTTVTVSTRFLPARRYASAGNRHSNVSVTRRYCVKTKKASVTISSPSGSPTVLVFWCQISSQNSKGFPRAGASN